MAKTYVNNLLNFKLTDEINLCGWSLGGHIALEMAYILEQKSFENINLYLLDTVIKDKYLINQLGKQDPFVIKQNMKAHMISEGYEEEYVNKVILASEAEIEISKQAISGMLKHSKIILFKALEEDERIDYEGRQESWKHIQSLKSNNIELFTKNIKVIDMVCNHGNILDHPLIFKLIEDN